MNHRIRYHIFSALCFAGIIGTIVWFFAIATGR